MSSDLSDLSKVVLARRLRIAALSRWRQSLPLLKDQTDIDKDREQALLIARHREVLEKDGELFLVAKDGTYQPVGTSPYRGLRAIAAEVALGLECTHSLVEASLAMIRVTLIQPSRRDAEDIRKTVVDKLIATRLDEEFDSLAKKLRATKAEKHLAQRVKALQGVGMETEQDREIRARVGITISEIRSV